MIRTLLFIVLMPCVLMAQSPVQEVIDAENAFAKASVDRGTREAFLANLSSSSVLYSQGEVVNGQELWQGFAADSSLLTWYPVYADVSADGSLGYTTGPYEFYVKRTDSNPAGSGFYSSVWRKEDGQWKVLTDLGVRIRDLELPSREVMTSKINGEISDVAKSSKELTATEEKYTALLNENATSFVPGFFAKEFRLHRPSRLPVTSLPQLSALDEKTLKFSFAAVGSEAASSGDLAFTYGKVKIEQTDPSKPGAFNGNYFRVWKRLGGEWKIVLDVVGL